MNTEGGFVEPEMHVALSGKTHKGRRLTGEDDRVQKVVAVLEHTPCFNGEPGILVRCFRTHSMRWIRAYDDQHITIERAWRP